MLQVSRNLSDVADGFLEEKVFVDGSRHEVLGGVSGHLRADRCESCTPTAALSKFDPNLERFMRSIKEECLEA